MYTVIFSTNKINVFFLLKYFSHVIALKMPSLNLLPGFLSNLLLLSHVNMENLYNPLMLQLSHLQDEENNNIYLVEL